MMAVPNKKKPLAQNPLGVATPSAGSLPTKPLPVGADVATVNNVGSSAGMNVARAEMLRRALPTQSGPTFGGYTPQQLAADPALAQKLGAAGAAKYQDYQKAQQQQQQPVTGQVKPAVAPRPLPATSGATPPIVATPPQGVMSAEPLMRLDPQQYQDAVAQDRAMVAQQTGAAPPPAPASLPVASQPAQAGPTAAQLKAMFPGLFAV